MRPIGKLPVLLVSLIGAFVVVRVVLRRRWGTVFLLVLFTHLASQASANVLKGVVHRLRPEVLFEKGSIGVGLWQSGPNNDSFPSGHVAVFFSLFWPFAVVFPRYRLPLVALPGLICIGRLILGQHYVSDVWFAVWMVVAFTELFRWLTLAVKALKNIALGKFEPVSNT
jgi:membrane-associated phospholipid phosphatase